MTDAEIISWIANLPVAARRQFFNRLPRIADKIAEAGFVILEKPTFDLLEKIAKSDSAVHTESIALANDLLAALAKHHPKRNARRDIQIIQMHADGETKKDILKALKPQFPKITLRAIANVISRANQAIKKMAQQQMSS